VLEFKIIWISLSQRTEACSAAAVLYVLWMSIDVCSPGTLTVRIQDVHPC
jgi:hypothetical protein